MSFPRRTKLFARPVHLRNMGGYLFDLLLLAFLWAAYLGCRELGRFASGAVLVAVPAHGFALLAAPGIYGIRLAMYIAMLRRNRAPQVAEWLAFLVPLILALPCFLVSGHLVRLYAAVSGYQFCDSHGSRTIMYRFVIDGAACPFPTGGNE